MDEKVQESAQTQETTAAAVSPETQTAREAVKLPKS